MTALGRSPLLPPFCPEMTVRIHRRTKDAAAACSAAFLFRERSRRNFWPSNANERPSILSALMANLPPQKWVLATPDRHRQTVAHLPNRSLPQYSRNRIKSCILSKRKITSYADFCYNWQKFRLKRPIRAIKRQLYSQINFVSGNFISGFYCIGEEAGTNVTQCRSHFMARARARVAGAALPRGDVDKMFGFPW